MSLIISLVYLVSLTAVVPAIALYFYSSYYENGKELENKCFLKLDEEENGKIDLSF